MIMLSYNHAGGVLGPGNIRLLHLSLAKEINNPIESQLEIVILEQNPVYKGLL
ncbi:hypothetical protein DER45DRAFT_580825 [Fusarium avenaceum]|nr:hypothetical protein DER45DRAFT_580825 [Fusarium avenaceum]